MKSTVATATVLGFVLAIGCTEVEKQPTTVSRRTSGPSEVTLTSSNAADSASVKGAIVGGKPHSPVVTGFSPGYVCKYYTFVYNPAPGATASVAVFNGVDWTGADIDVPNDTVLIETPHDGSTWSYRVQVTAPGDSGIYSPLLNVTGYAAGAYPKC